MAWVLALLFIFAAVAIAFAMSGLYGWFPLAASAMARDYDDQFLLTLLLTGFFFILMHLILSYIVVRFRGGRGPASYWHGNIKWVWAVIIVMALLDLGLAVGSESLWAKLHLTGSPPNVLQIEVVGQQFVWTSRYKGPDGRFGRVKRDLVDDAVNILGLDPADCESSSRIADRFIEGLADLGVLVVDVRAEIAALPSPPYWRKDLHMDFQAHELTASALFEHLR